MKEINLEIIENKQLSCDTYEMRLAGDCGCPVAGQFIEMSVPNHYLRRPFGVADYKDNILTVLYKVVGRGTHDMSKLLVGTKLNTLVNLGNGFDIKDYQHQYIIGGGIGIAPLYKLAKDLKEKGVCLTILLGYRTQSEMFYQQEFEKLGKVIVTTDDGSYGYKGNVIDYITANNLNIDNYYACGPLIMLKRLAEINKNGQLSLEERMGCGFGACMGCSIKTIYGPKRVCKEGPVFTAKEIIFDE